MPMTLRPLAQFDTFALAGLLVSTLEEAGFHPAPVSDAEHVGTAGVARGFTVRVPAPEVDAAAALIKERGFGQHLIAH